MLLTPLILAAGSGRRMGTTKALAVWESETFLGRIVRTCAACAPLSLPIVVIGAQAHAVRAAHPGLLVCWLENPHWSTTDMLASLRLALQAQKPDSAALVWPIDCPRVPLSVLEALLANPPKPATIPTYQGRPGHPVALSPDLCKQILSDAGLRSLRDALPGATHIPTEAPEILDNFNSPLA